MANAVDATIRVNYFAPPQRFSAVLGDSALLEAAFTDANGLPCFPADAAITVQPPATTETPMPAPIVLTMTSTPPLVIVGMRYQVEIAPGWTGAWGARASCTTPAYAAQDTGFDIVASSSAVPAPESPSYPPQALVDPTGASATAAAQSAQAAAASAAQAGTAGAAAGAAAGASAGASAGLTAGASSGATAGAAAGAAAITSAGLDDSTAAGRALLKAADAGVQRTALGLDGRVPATATLSGSAIVEVIDGVTVTTTLAPGVITAVYGAPVNQTWVTTISGNTVSTVRTA
jgi:hypothetical protein